MTSRSRTIAKPRPRYSVTAGTFVATGRDEDAAARIERVEAIEQGRRDAAPERTRRDDQPIDVDGPVGQHRPRDRAGQPVLVGRAKPLESGSAEFGQRLGQGRDAVVGDERRLDRVRLALEVEDRPGHATRPRGRASRRASPPVATQAPDALGRPAARPGDRFGVAIAARSRRPAAVARSGPRRRTRWRGTGGSIRRTGSWNVIDVALVDGVHPEVVEDEPVAGVLGVGRPARCASIGDAWLNANRPPGRSRRATSGTVRYGSAKVIAPWSQKTMSNDASGSGTASALASTSGKSTPASAISRRACSSCRAETSRPTIRAPRCASAIDHCAAPQPNSRTSLPATSPRIRRSASGILVGSPGGAAAVGELAPVAFLVLVAVALPHLAVARDVVGSGPPDADRSSSGAL